MVQPGLRVIPEHPSDEGGRLGRHVNFDERSKSYRVQKAGSLKSKMWSRTVPAWDQGSLGRCTCEGAMGLKVTAPFKQKGFRVTDKLTKDLYRYLTNNDSVPGGWEPEDTGSTVLDAMKMLVTKGYAKSYHWCLGTDDVLSTLSNVGPVEFGFNWYEGFDHAGPDGLVSVSGSIRGGHAFEGIGIDVKRRLIWCVNSWGPNFGKKGRFAFSFDDLDRLMHEDGEASTIAI